MLRELAGGRHVAIASLTERLHALAQEGQSAALRVVYQPDLSQVEQMLYGGTDCLHVRRIANLRVEQRRYMLDRPGEVVDGLQGARCLRYPQRQHVSRQRLRHTVHTRQHMRQHFADVGPQRIEKLIHRREPAERHIGKQRRARR